VCNSSAHVNILARYDFNKGGYALVGITKDKDSLTSEIGNFYITDTVVLNKIKSEWIFEPMNILPACPDLNYFIYIVKDGLEAERFSINSSLCKMLMSDRNFFHFNSEKIRNLKTKLKKPLILLDTFISIEDARKQWEKYKGNKELIMINTPDWLHFEGKLEFTYPMKFESNSFSLAEQLKPKIFKQIQDTYFDEKFRFFNLISYYKTGIIYSIYCNKTLFDKFELYPQEEKKWKSFPLELRSVWKTK